MSRLVPPSFNSRNASSFASKSWSVIEVSSATSSSLFESYSSLSSGSSGSEVKLVAVVVVVGTREAELLVVLVGATSNTT